MERRRERRVERRRERRMERRRERRVESDRTVVLLDVGKNRVPYHKHILNVKLAPENETHPAHHVELRRGV
jgi:hypothetical protein